MNFENLMAKMRELDQPVPEAAVIETPVEECGEPMGMTPPMSAEKETTPPSMTVNINAQGMDDIGELMALLTKVNPDMLNQKEPMPTLSPEPSIMSIKPEMPPLKMLPDFDADNDDMPGGEKDIEIKGLDQDGDGDHDMDDHDAEKKDKEEAFANSALDDAGPDTMNADPAFPFNANGNDLNKPKGTFPKVAGGDNPMQKDSFRESIRAELQKRLNEAKGSK
jgi:hypothetical protein